MVELIPGTALPFHVGPGGEQVEGRGAIQLRPEREPMSLLERIDDPASLTPSERHFVAAALSAYDRSPKLERSIFAKTSRQSDATTGNLVIELYEVPAGYEGHLAFLTVDEANDATVVPSAPVANAAAWSFVAKLPASSGVGTGDVGATSSFRRGLVDFAPVSSAGPMMPFQWKYNDSNAPIAFGGETFFYVQVGGSQAGLVSKMIQATFRVNLYAHGLLP